MTVNVCIVLIASNRPHKKALGEIVRKQNALTIADTRVKEVNYHRRNDMIEDVSRKKKKKKMNSLKATYVFIRILLLPLDFTTRIQRRYIRICFNIFRIFSRFLDS